MWVCVNDFTPLEPVLVALIKSATWIDTKDLDLDQLQYKFRQIIRGKRFLLALDDVWDENQKNWDDLKMLLDFGGEGSRILATMRSERVARSMYVTNLCCRLKGLSDESAWLLFKRKAFGEDQGQIYQGDLEQIGQKIVKKCANVPLAVVTIASLLRGEEKETWIRLEKDELSQGAPDEHSKIMQILKISYNRLPYAVKSCFAYCSLFPKQYRFKKALLVHLWLAQGFVEPYNASRSLEGIAEGYFSCLVERCFFQDMKSNWKGVYSWGMHDLVHDLAVEVARVDCVLASERALNCWDKKTRHVSFDREFESLVSSACSFSHSKGSRTLLCLRMVFLQKNVLNKIFSSFKSLGVLRLSSSDIVNVPSSIGELIHLRYVDLSRSSIEKLPNSICNLPHLQTLNLKKTHLREFPKDIGKLVSLRHLVYKGSVRQMLPPGFVSIAPRFVTQMPPGLAGLTSLVTLDKLVVHGRTGGLRYLELLDNLNGSLEIELLLVTGWKNARMDAERSFLSRKNKLRSLAIQWASKCEVRDLHDQEDVTMMMDALQPHPNLEHLSKHTFNGKEMPSWIMGLHNLVSLKLESCEGCAELLPLSHLSCLKELHISDMPLVSVIEDNIIDFDPDLFFRSLETLSISRMQNLTSWWLQAPRVVPSFPRVTRVNIALCSKLTASMPLFPLVLESLVLSHVQEELIWHGIRSEPTGHTSHGNNVLKRLSLSNIRGLWSISEAHIRDLSALQELIINDAVHDELLTSVSCVGLSYLTSLEVLRIRRSPCLEWIDGDDERAEVPWAHLSRLRILVIPNISKSLFKGLKYLTCLEDLEIHNFGPLLQSVSDSEEEEEGMPWKSLEKLRSLVIEFGETSGHLLKGVQYLMSLRDLVISDYKEPHLPWNALLGIKNLNELTFRNMAEVTAVEPTVVGQMPISTLQVLRIYSAPTHFVHDIPWKSFPTLYTLHLENVSSLEALPEGIQHLASLRQLRILGARSLLSLPYWMSSLSTLTFLHMDNASDELRERCKEPTGQDWPKIRHIRCILIV